MFIPENSHPALDKLSVVHMSLTIGDLANDLQNGINGGEIVGRFTPFDQSDSGTDELLLNDFRTGKRAAVLFPPSPPYNNPMTMVEFDDEGEEIIAREVPVLGRVVIEGTDGIDILLTRSAKIVRISRFILHITDSALITQMPDSLSIEPDIGEFDGESYRKKEELLTIHSPIQQLLDHIRYAA